MKKLESRPLVVFDLGRVLVRICDDWRHGCEMAGVPAPSRELTDAVKFSLKQAVIANETGAIDLDGFATVAAPLLGIDVEHVVALSNAYLLGVFEGVEQLIDDLHAAGVGTACLSNTNANHWEMMISRGNEAYKPLEKLQRQFASHLIQARKPDDAIYEHVEVETRTPPGQIIFFDDLVDNVEAAKARGWKAHLVPRCENPVPMIRQTLVEAGLLRA